MSISNIGLAIYLILVAIMDFTQPTPYLNLVLGVVALVTAIAILARK